MRKHLRAAAMMVGVMASGGAWAETDTDERERREAPDPRHDRDASPLPGHVAERLGVAFPAATVAGVTRWGPGYEASLVDGLRRFDVLLDPVGNIVERHVPVAVKELPAPVLATLARTHPRHTLWRATRIETEAGDFHEVLLARGDQRAAIVLDPDARVLAGLRA